MKDSAAINQIDPGTVDMIGYYVDGRYVPTAAQLARFAGKVHVPIAVDYRTDAGIVFDGPPDNDTWQETVDWVVMRRKKGVDPSVYTNQSSWTTAIAAFNARGVAQPHWWIAAWDNRAEMIPGAVAHQYETVPNRWDTSIVADYWPGIDPAPTHPPVPPTSAPPPGAGTPKPAGPAGPTPQQIMEEDRMILMSTPSGVWLLSGSMYVEVAAPTDVTAFVNAGVAHIGIDAAMHANLQAASAALTGKLSGSLNISGQLQAT